MLEQIFISDNSYLLSRKNEAVEIFKTLLDNAVLTPSDEDWAGLSDLEYAVVKWNPRSKVSKYVLIPSRTAFPQSPVFFEDLASLLEYALKRWW